MSLKKNGISLYYEKEQTEKKCLVAIKSNMLKFKQLKCVFMFYNKII